MSAHRCHIPLRSISIGTVRRMHLLIILEYPTQYVKTYLASALAAESADTLIVYDVQFLEVDTSGNLIVINQDDTYNNVSLTTGDTITFDSVSANLNPDEPLSSQLEYVPGGVLIKLVAKNEGSDTIVRQQVSWLYTNSCDDLPTSVGDAIGWITLVS